MAVHFRRDEELPTVHIERDESEDENILRDALGQAMRNALIITILGGVLLAGYLWLGRKSLIAADHLLRDPGSEFQEMCMPLVIFAILGGAFGVFLSWRIISAVSIAGSTAWGVASAAAVVLAIGGGIIAAMMFDGVPTMAWIGLATLVVVAVASSRVAVTMLT